MYDTLQNVKLHFLMSLLLKYKNNAIAVGAPTIYTFAIPSPNI